MNSSLGGLETFGSNGDSNRIPAWSTQRPRVGRLMGRESPPRMALLRCISLPVGNRIHGDGGIFDTCCDLKDASCINRSFKQAWGGLGVYFGVIACGGVYAATVRLYFEIDPWSMSGYEIWRQLRGPACSSIGTHLSKIEVIFENVEAKQCQLEIRREMM